MFLAADAATATATAGDDCCSVQAANMQEQLRY
jgi:hypothetical protein